MMRAIIAFLFFVSSINCFAETTYCQIFSELSFRSIEWDDKSGLAKATDFSGETYPGKVSSIRKHNQGVKVNIDIDYRPAALGERPAEFVIFQDSNVSFKVFGVSYKLKDGKRLLDISWGNNKAECIKK